MSILIFIIILSILVLIHEFGHFIAAKKNGVFVEEFGLGLPPRVWGKKIGDTLYSLNWLPFGGFVKLYGEEEAELTSKTISDKKKNQAFTHKKPAIKLIILTAGVGMNVLLAIIIFYLLLSTHGFVSDPLILFSDYKFRFGTEKKIVLITTIAPNTPATKTSLKGGDVIEQIKNGSGQWKYLNSVTELISTTNNVGDKPLYLQTKSVLNNEKKVIAITPIYDKDLKRMVIGVGLADSVALDYNNNKILSGVLHSYNMVAYHINVMSTLIASSIKERKIEQVTQAVSGPVGILTLVDDIVKTSGQKVVENLLNLLAIMSLSLAVINIFPFPALDGGRAAIVVYEWVRGRRINPKIEQRINFVGFAFLLSLIGLITLHDIFRIFVK